MYLDNWMVVVMLGVFGLGLYRMWKVGFEKGVEAGSLSLAAMLNDYGLVDIEVDEYGVWKITELKNKVEEDE